MQIQKRLVVSLSLALLVFFSSLFIPLTPCKTSSTALNSESSWGFCSLNPDLTRGYQTTSNSYFGYIDSLTQTYITLLILVFSLTFIVTTIIFKSKKS